MALTRRAFAAATAAGVVAPTVARAKECPAAAMDWMTMSLEARNLAYFVGQENGRNGTSIPPPTRRHRASCIFTAVTGSAAARKYLPASPKGPWQAAGRQRCQATHLLLRRA